MKLEARITKLETREHADHSPQGLIIPEVGSVEEWVRMVKEYNEQMRKTEQEYLKKHGFQR